MDRFIWTDGVLGPEERLVLERGGVRIYDGEDKTSFDHGKLLLTTHRLIWRHHTEPKCVISLALSLAVLAEELAATFTKSAKIVLHVSSPPEYKPPGPKASSLHNFLRFSFKEGGQAEFFRCLQEELQQKRWQMAAPPPAISTQTASSSKVRTGIGGIEKTLQQKHQASDKKISLAFEDLSNLMVQAKEMVTLSKNVSQKIKDKQGDITEDETVRFKSYLLSLGISDPVTRETHGTGDKYFREMAREIASTMEQPLKECGGIMTLTDIYCRINRARGMELVSPDDVVNACKLMDHMHLPVILQVFESGVMVLQLRSLSQQQTVMDTVALVEEAGSVTGDEFSRLVGLSVVLSKERLLAAERLGKLCRDDTAEGLRFFPNHFLTPPVP